MNNKVIALLVLIVLVALGFFLFRGETGAPAEVDNGAASGTSLEGSEGADFADTPGLELGQLREFTVDAQNFSFSPAEMKVNEGDTVRITLVNKQGVHDLKIDEFGVETGTLQVGESKTVEFVASEKGTFEYYCSIGSHRSMGMVGNLIVE